MIRKSLVATNDFSGTGFQPVRFWFLLQAAENHTDRSLRLFNTRLFVGHGFSRDIKNRVIKSALAAEALEP